MFNIFTTLLKAGSPTVDLKINQPCAQIGETITGCFYLHGGRKTQKIKRLECSLVKEYEDGSFDTVEEVTTILMSKQLSEKETLEFPFTFVITDKFQPTTSNITYRFHTNLVYSDNLSSKDHDELVILTSEGDD